MEQTNPAVGPFLVDSEIGRLRSVLVHRPGLEIARITPANMDALLFDDLLWLDRAQEEHDRFVEILGSQGAEVLYFEDLLTDLLRVPERREAILDEVLTPARCGPHVADRLRGAMLEAEVEAVRAVLVGGILEPELEEWGIAHPFADLAADRFDYILRPLPNLLFMRDNAAWIGDGVALSVLRSPARERESLYMRHIYRHHPRFAGAESPEWYGYDPQHRYPASLEGGDVLVLDARTVVVGLGERTAPAAVEMLARELFARSGVEQVVAVHLRKDRSVMHLDTVFTMVDVDCFNVFPGVLDDADVQLIRTGPDGGVTVEDTPGLLPTLRECLGRDDLRVVTTGGDAIGRLREQWDDGNNTLAVAPGVVVAYERNGETNRRLTDAGITVLELDASELCRGRGGSRCMTQPLLRDPVSA